MRVTAKLTAILGVVLTCSLATPLVAQAHVAYDGKDLPPTTATVALGDSLSSIANKDNTTWQALAVWNNIADPNVIVVGQVLNLPPTGFDPPPGSYSLPAQPTKPAATHTYTVSHAAAAPRTASYVPSGIWQCIGHWESGNNPSENTGNGFYGEWQFAASTWQNMMRQMYPSNTPYMGYPYAAAAPESVQLAAAQRLESEAGYGQWPQTSKKCGV